MISTITSRTTTAIITIRTIKKYRKEQKKRYKAYKKHQKKMAKAYKKHHKKHHHDDD